MFTCCRKAIYWYSASLLCLVLLFLSQSVHVCLQLISPNNVATYGTLCALATFDRQEIQRHVLNSRLGLTVLSSRLVLQRGTTLVGLIFAAVLDHCYFRSIALLVVDPESLLSRSWVEHWKPYTNYSTRPEILAWIINCSEAHCWEHTS